MIGLGKRLMGKPPSGVDLKAKAIAVWEFDGNSMTAYDSHGNHDGTASGMVAPDQTGKINKAWYFVSSITPLLTVPYSSALTPSTWGYYSWIQPASMATRGLLIGAGGSGYSTGWAIMLSSAGHFTFEYGDGSTNRDFDFGSYSNNNWYLIGIDWDGTDFKAYVNNSLVWTESNASFSYHLSYPQNYDWKFGPGAPTNYDGYYDQSSFFNAPLTDAERAFLWSNGNGIAYANW